VSDAASAVIVTGGSAGIGQALCRDFLAAGHRVVSLDRKPNPIDDPALCHVSLDLMDDAATRAAAADIVARFAPTTIVHNAGVVRAALLPDVQRADLDALVSLHLGAALSLVQAALPAMQAAKFGRIVLISSRAALGLQTRTSYSATKAALIGMTRTWALELAPQGITVNAVAPGPIGATEMFHDVLPPGDPRIDKLAGSIPVGRLGEPRDVSRAVLFLAHRDSGFITGQTLFVCGGTSVGSLTI
jgi:3-oxoacyl-[acyl-carrier protein] reductase